MATAAALEGAPSAAVVNPEFELVKGSWVLVRRQLHVPTAISNRKELLDDLLCGEIMQLPGDVVGRPHAELQTNQSGSASYETERFKFFHIGSVMLLQRNGEELRRPHPNLIIEEGAGGSYSIEPTDGPSTISLL